MWLWPICRVKSARALNTVGLLLGIIGVLIIFVWGPPQPSFQTGVSIVVEDSTPIDRTGKTAGEHAGEVLQNEKHYGFMSKLGLGLIMVGFGLQLWAVWLPSFVSGSAVSQSTATCNESDTPAT